MAVKRNLCIFLPPSPLGPGMISSPALDVANLSAILKEGADYHILLVDFRQHTINNDGFWRDKGVDPDIFGDFNRCFEHLLKKPDIAITHLAGRVIKELPFALKDLHVMVFSVSILEQFSLQYLTSSLVLAQLLKKIKPGMKIVFFGNCPREHARSVMAHFDFIDAFLEDGNEFSLLEYILHPEVSSPVRGVCVRAGGKILSTDLERRTPLERYPLPDFSVFDLDKYRCNGKLVLPYEISRGCLNNCFFCYYIHKSGIDYKLIDKAAAELKALSDQHQTVYFHFMDAAINFNRDYLVDFSRAVKKDVPGIKWSALAVPNIESNTLRLMKESGCVQLRWGVEYGSDRMLKLIGKKTTVAGIKKVLKDAHGLGIYNYITLLSGLSSETADDRHKTMEFLKEMSTCIDSAKECPWGELGHFSIPQLEGLLNGRQDKGQKNRAVFQETLKKYNIASEDIIQAITAKKRISFMLVPNRDFPEVIKEGEGGDEKNPHLEIFSSISYLAKKFDNAQIEYTGFPLLLSKVKSISSYFEKIGSDRSRRSALIHKIMMRFVVKGDYYIFYIPLWSENLASTAELAKAVKSLRPNARIVVFGPCCRLYYKEILENFSSIDIVLISEPEEALAGIIRDEPIESIPNIAHIAGNKICAHPEKGVSLDDPRLRLDYSAYFEFLDKYSLARPAFLYFETSRGCKYNCFFCSLLTARKLRMKRAGSAVKELAGIVKAAGIRQYYFVDNELNFDNKHLNEFLDELISSRIGIKWSCYMVARGLDRKIIKRLSAAGCIHIRWGIETANPEKQKMMSKNLNTREVSAILRMSHDAGIKNQIAFTLGYPRDCQKDVNLILEFLEQNRSRVDIVNLYRFKPRRNSIIYQHPGDFGIEIIKNMDSLWRDEVPFNETNGLNWRLKKEQQRNYLDLINSRIRSLGLDNIDPEVYFRRLIV